MRRLSARALLAKTITTRDLDPGGYLLPEQAERFIDYMTDDAILWKMVQVITMDSHSRYLDDISVNKRIIRRGIEAEEPTELAGIETGRRELTTEEIILPYDLSFHFLEDNIEGADVEDTIARLMATQFGNDLEDLAINGNENADPSDPDYPFLSIKNGWLTIAEDDPKTHKYDNEGSRDYRDKVFKEMLAMMPEKYKRNPEGLVFLVDPETEEEYRDQVAHRQTGLGDTVLESGQRIRYKGIPIQPVPYFPENTQLLTNPKNLAVGIWRQIRIGRQVQERRRVIEFTTTIRAGFQYTNSDIMVVSRDRGGNGSQPGNGGGGED